MNEDFQNRFGGVARLYGEAGLAHFRGAHVAVVGIGGVGSWVAEGLARSGVGRLTLMDLDEVCITNVNRQLHARTETLGQMKVLAMAERVRGISPECKVLAQEAFFGKKTVEDLFGQGNVDVVVDAIDVFRPKSLLLAECRKREIPVITCGGVGGRRKASEIRTDDLARTHNCGLLNQVRKELRANYGFPRGQQKQSRRAKKFGIAAIHSLEVPVFPQGDGSVGKERVEGVKGSLTCAEGYGSAVQVTATCGMFAVDWVLEILMSASTSE